MPGKTNVKRAKEAKKRIEESREGRKWFKAEVGDTQIRLLPPWAEHLDWPFFESANHRLDNRTIFICPKAHDGETFCYACDVVMPKLYKGNEDDQARAYNIRATKRIFCNVLERENEEIGAQIWGISTARYDELVSYFSDPDYRDITDVDKGHDLVLTRKGTTKEDTSYSLRAKPKKTPVGNDDVLGSLPNLDEDCSGAPTEEQKRMLKDSFGLTFDGEEESEEEPSTEEGDTSFDFKEKSEDKPDVETEETSEDEDSELVPIQVPNHIKGKKMKDLYIQKTKETSPCFGKRFNEDASACVSDCQAIIECMGEFTA